MFVFKGRGFRGFLLLEVEFGRFNLLFVNLIFSFEIISSRVEVVVTVVLERIFLVVSGFC